MTDTLSIALAQLNPTVGDVEGNEARVREARARAAAAGADLVVTPELALSGYPPEDLVLKPVFLERVRAAVERLAQATADGGPALLIGAPWRVEDKTYNAALLLDGGKIASVRLKHHLPNYGVFDEVRVFASGPAPGPMAFRGVRLGAMVCEDCWFEDVAETLGESGAEILLIINGSPFEADKPDQRANIVVARVKETGLPCVYVNQVGGQDELVFDGASFVLNADCSLAAQALSFTEDLLVTRWRRNDDGWRCEPAALAKPPEGSEKLYSALVLGLRDYVDKNRFPGIILGLSGGVDSALALALGVDALGADRCRAVMMPSRYTSRDSLDDAEECARLLGVRLDTIEIEPAIAAFGAMLAPTFEGRKPDITEENIQSRVRGLTLMALSNKLGPMVLSTGNKSEMAVGYATLYGDMCGGYSVLKDVYKMEVYALSRWRNQDHGALLRGPKGRVIPERILTKAPTAELRDNQKDSDSLPEYPVLDDILAQLIEGEKGIAEIVAHGHEESVVRRVWRMLDRAEYKRRQAPPGVKITARAFGRDRRYPITNRFVDTM
jgi:NAD+ synthase